ncbi:MULTISPECIES: efflux RND transporter periplasmic adaptor subunit [Pseudomonas]|uniref:efflux RND transporter periplasmic adaptor subunit n=1 Tax=Pseudomonas TaxID=286 RepID=UPI000A1EB151|nr:MULTISPECIES: efflux RND transporter periplasmic adaptor subunit [unclassified Pseudomonas]POA52569.1 efflux transporter periplasmic adaptor subunit [Pseudomonas sp. FW507-12TSA]
MPDLKRYWTSFGPGTSLVVIASIAAALTACSDDSGQAGVPAAAQVSAAQVVIKPVRQWDEFSGRIAATDAVEVRARVSGYIERIAFKEGDEVKPGDLLYRIDPRPYKASYDSAQAQLARARATAELARVQEQRAQVLVAVNAISRELFDTRRAAATQGAADVRAAEAALASAQLNLEFTEVRSPIAGQVGRAMLTVGNLVQADQSVLTSVISQDPLYLYFQPDEQSFLRYMALARAGQRSSSANPVRIGLASDSGFPHVGVVDFVNNQVDPATGTITLRAVVANPQRLLIPGLYARVQLQGSGEFSAMLVDDKAILTDQDRKYVYVVGAKNEALRKDVKLGGFADGLRIVQAGLAPEDRVIVAGLQKILFPGAPVDASTVAMGAATSITAK